jgi:hypothetical protein
MLLLVAALSYCYVRWLERESAGWLAGTMAAAAALVYTNYFGWLLVGLLALDAALFRKPRRWRAWRESAGALLLLSVLFAPLWPLLLHLSQHPDVRVQGSKLAAYIFDMYALLVSESFAPWFFAVGIPVALLCVLCYVLTLVGTRGLARRFYIYFLVLSAVLAAAGLSNTKRFPFCWRGSSCRWLRLSREGRRRVFARYSHGRRASSSQSDGWGRSPDATTRARILSTTGQMQLCLASRSIKRAVCWSMTIRWPHII